MTATRQHNPLVELLVTIVIPSIILMKFSDESALGPVWGLVVALAFPLGWGGIDFVRHAKVNLFAVLGLVSVLLTGGIGLLQLDNQWLAVKEAAIPGIIGLVVIGSTQTRYPLIRALFYNPTLIDTARIETQLDARGTRAAFEARLRNATWLVGGTFFFSSAMNYFLATWIVTSPAGSPAFNEELGRLTLMSYPMIAVPSMLMMAGVFWWIARGMKELTGLSLMDVFHHAEAKE